jgi:hypothetical protein
MKQQQANSSATTSQTNSTNPGASQEQVYDVTLPQSNDLSGTSVTTPNQIYSRSGAGYNIPSGVATTSAGQQQPYPVNS